MEYIDNIKKITRPYKNAVITIGNFDGVHIGHQCLFHEVIERAEGINGTSIAMTFDPHPMKVLRKEGCPFPLITLSEQKIELIKKSGIDVLITIPFTKEFASLSAREFVHDLLVRKIGVKAIIVGNDYTFGKNREGDLSLLRQFGKEYDFNVFPVPWIPVPGEKIHRISSTSIRNLVMNGDMERAQKMLGRNYQIRGIVGMGRNRGGKLLGFPTANINLYDELRPLSAVYAVTVEYNSTSYKGVANIGYSPTFGDGIFTVEVHLIDFNKDIYGENIKVNFIRRLRGEIKFNNFQELSDQIRHDIENAKKIIG